MQCNFSFVYLISICYPTIAMKQILQDHTKDMVASKMKKVVHKDRFIFWVTSSTVFKVYM